MKFLFFAIFCVSFGDELKWKNPGEFRHEKNVGEINRWHHVNKNSIFSPWDEGES